MLEKLLDKSIYHNNTPISFKFKSKSCMFEEPRINSATRFVLLREGAG